MQNEQTFVLHITYLYGVDFFHVIYTHQLTDNKSANIICTQLACNIAQKICQRIQNISS